LTGTLRGRRTAADQFVVALEAAMEDIERDPARNRVFCGRLRRVFLDHYPNYVCYKVYPHVRASWASCMCGAIRT
jgi:hypothetical protein